MNKSLAEHTPEELYRALTDIHAYRTTEGRGRSEGAACVRAYCSERKREVRAELRRRGLPTTEEPWHWRTT